MPVIVKSGYLPEQVSVRDNRFKGKIGGHRWQGRWTGGSILLLQLVIQCAESSNKLLDLMLEITHFPYRCFAILANI